MANNSTKTVLFVTDSWDAMIAYEKYPMGNNWNVHFIMSECVADGSLADIIEEGDYNIITCFNPDKRDTIFSRKVERVLKRKLCYGDVIKKAKTLATSNNAKFDEYDRLLIITDRFAEGELKLCAYMVMVEH